MNSMDAIEQMNTKDLRTKIIALFLTSQLRRREKDKSKRKKMKQSE